MKNVKKILSIIIVCLLNINTYAAIGGNDGSAFITKSEFDALVNTFNEQMDSYESSLVTKIDGAIANYLDGLSTENILPQTNLVALANSYANGGKLVWYKDFTAKDTNESNIMVQEGETVFCNTDIGAENVWRFRVYGQPANANYWKSGTTKGNYYVMTKDKVVKNYYKDAYEKHYFAGSASQSYNPDTKSIEVPDIHYLEGKTDTSVSVYVVTTTEGTNQYPAYVVQYLNLEKTVENTYNNSYMWSSMPDKEVWTIYEDEQDKVSSQETVTGNVFQIRLNGQSMKYNNPVATKYKPKAQKINLNTCISEPVTSAYEEEVKVYQGCPILKCSDDGEVRFTMKWVTTGGAASAQFVQFGLNRNSPFNNESIVSIDPSLNTNITQNMAASGNEIPVSIYNCKKGDVIWIKGLPLSTSATLEITELVMNIED